MSTTSQGSAFEKEVEQILRLKGYSVVRNNLINGTQIDLLATKGDPLDNVELVVECTDRTATIGIDLVKEKSAVLLSLQGTKSIFRLMYVSRHGFTAEAKAFADSQSNITLLSLNELENLLVDLSPYVISYLHNYEKSLGVFKDAKLFENYIDLSARDERGVHMPSLGRFVRDWLKDEDNNLLFLLGDYGAGKTSFCRNLAYRLLVSKYRELSTERFTPILINLRDSRGKLDLKKVVSDTLGNFYGVDLRSFASFERLCSNGNILLILDGFDEMSDRCDANSIIDAFNQIYLFATLDAKVILTCRSNFFKSNSDIIELLRRFSITVPIASEPSLLELSLKDHGKVLYVENLNSTQIRSFIEKRFGERTDEMLATIKRIHDLSDLSARPVLLDMIVSTLPELEQDKRRINSAALYSHYTDSWTNRDQWRVTIPLKVRQSFCEVLAWAMHCADVSGISFAMLEQLMVNALRVMADTQERLDKFKNDIQTCSFLVRIGENDEFRFAHKSFREFFVARKIVSSLISGAKLQKSGSTQLLPELKKAEPVLTCPLYFSSSPGAGKSSFLEYYRNSLNDRLRSSGIYQGLIDVEISSIWSGISSEASVRSHLEAEIRAVFSDKWLPRFSDDIGVSEEIATFAIEHLSNICVNFEDLSSKLLTPEMIDIFCDLIRLSKASEWVQQNSDSLRNYAVSGANAHLKIAAMACVIKHPKIVSIEVIREFRSSIHPEGWSYILFEMASSAIDYSSLMTRLFHEDSLSLIDQVICIYGLSGRLPKDRNNEKVGSLVSRLMNSEDEQERSLAIKVCYSLPAEKRIAVILQAIGEADSKSLKKAFLCILEESTDLVNWKSLRGLAAREIDPDIRESLQKAERHLRDIQSRRQDRPGWDRLKGSRAIRESMWKWRRS